MLKYLLILIALGSSCKNQKKISDRGPFMGIEYSTTPVLLFPEYIASPFDEYNGTFSPDGKVFFYTTNTPNKGIITWTKMNKDGFWEKPTVAPFSGKYSEYDPIFSPDGSKLYFTSERPKEDDQENGKTNIWYVEEIEGKWSNPKMVELREEGTYYSSLTTNNIMYFNIWDTGDMYKTDLKDSIRNITALDTIINSQNGEGDPFVSPNEDYLIFRGYNNSLGNGDLYISYNNGGQWSVPINLGEPINSSAHEMCPYVTSNGEFLIFASNRIHQEYDSNPNENLDDLLKKYNSHDNGNLNIYYISTNFIEDLRPSK